MGLKCQLFTLPKPDPRLERCLVDDAGHITQGTRGDHVKKVQMALNQLSAGPGRENFNLKVDGWYGPKTAAAVKLYKSAPQRRERIKLQPWQKTHDDIVGKQTIRSLDDEMEILEEENPGADTLFSTTDQGPPGSHDHKKCPRAAQGAEDIDEDGFVSHVGTPLNPLAFGRKINIFGAHETDHLGFEDYAINGVAYVNGRPWTMDKPPPLGRGVRSGTASDICTRSSPLNDQTLSEIARIAMPGGRMTYASNDPSARAMQFFRSLGPAIAHGKVWYTYRNKPQEMEVLVVQLLLVGPTMKPPFALQVDGRHGCR